MTVGEIPRLIYTVVSVDEFGGGMATDGTMFEGEPVEIPFETQTPGTIDVGDRIAGVIRGEAIIRDVIIERGRNAVREH